MAFLISQEVTATYVGLSGRTVSQINVGTNPLTSFMWSIPSPKKTRGEATALFPEIELGSFRDLLCQQPPASLLAKDIDVLSK